MSLIVHRALGYTVRGYQVKTAHIFLPTMVLIGLHSIHTVKYSSAVAA